MKTLSKRLCSSRLAIAVHDVYGVSYDVGEKIESLRDRMIDVLDIMEHMQAENFGEASMELITKSIMGFAREAAVDMVALIDRLSQPATKESEQAMSRNFYDAEFAREFRDTHAEPLDLPSPDEQEAILAALEAEWIAASDRAELDNWEPEWLTSIDPNEPPF